MQSVALVACVVLEKTCINPPLWYGSHQTKKKNQGHYQDLVDEILPQGLCTVAFALCILSAQKSLPATRCLPGFLSTSFRDCMIVHLSKASLTT
jgi:hypothetical protein